jgi:hypothetical protein
VSRGLNLGETVDVAERSAAIVDNEQRMIAIVSSSSDMDDIDYDEPQPITQQSNDNDGGFGQFIFILI